jgi:hypothetical protein
MTAVEYKSSLNTCYVIVGVLRDLPLQEMVDAINRAESFGAILDPTLYRKQAQSMAEDARVIRALLHVQRELQPYLARVSESERG